MGRPVCQEAENGVGVGWEGQETLEWVVEGDGLLLSNVLFQNQLYHPPWG